jgi:two-component system nitrate/nitrite response regulator NarL
MPRSARRIAVALVEDSRDYVAGLADFLGTLPDIAIAGVFHTGQAARAGLAACRPEVVLLDLGLPDQSGLDLLPQVAALVPEAEILILTTFEDPASIRRSIERGASGFVLKRSGLLEVAAAVRKVATGGAPFSDSVARELLSLFRQRRDSSALLPRLSPQENRLLQLLSEGRSLKQAASEAGITYETSRRYMASVYRKLNVNSMTQALTYYFQAARGRSAGPIAH